MARHRVKIRKDSIDSLMDTIGELTFINATDTDLKRENANIDGDTAMGIMLKYGSEVAKQYNLDNLVSKDIATAHRNGDIHIHDLDFMSLTATCCQIDLEKLFTGGFNTGNGYIREPEEIRSYGALACIAIQANQNEMHGGQSIPAFDYYMAVGVAKSFCKKIKNILDIRYPRHRELNSIVYEDIRAYRKRHRLIMNKEGIEFIRYTLDKKHTEIISHREIELIIEMAVEQVENDTYQTMEAVIHNLNTMHSRAGAQVPFSSLNYGTDTSTEGRMVIRNLLKATERGLGNGETPIFPVQVFKVKNGVNYKETDPNYDLFKYSMVVSSKRLFPNYTFIDTPFNLKYYKKGDIKSEVATMGCLSGEELIHFKIDKEEYILNFKDSYTFIRNKLTPIQYSSSTEYIDTYDHNISIYDSYTGDFVKVKKFIRNTHIDNWRTLTFEDGQTLSLTGDHPLPIIGKGRITADNIKSGDKIYRTGIKLEHTLDIDNPYLKGLLVGERLSDTTNKLKNVYIDPYKYLYEGEYEEDSLNSRIFRAKLEDKYMFIAGIIENSRIHYNDDYTAVFRIDTTNKSLINSVCYLLNGLGLKATISNRFTTSKGIIVNLYSLDFIANKQILNFASIKFKTKRDKIYIHDSLLDNTKYSNIAVVKSINSISLDEDSTYSYDVETVSDRFDVSGLQSHNCRTRVMSNIHNKNNETSVGRGNLSFTTINLPRLAIKASNGVIGKGDIDLFYSLLDTTLELVHRQLLERFEIQCKRHPRNYPFLMGQGVWTGTDTLCPNEDIREVLKEGSLSVGFIGLAETLKMLTGEHHGESTKAQQLGLDIIGYMRNKTDEWSAKEKMNYGVIGTPAEGLSGRFVKLDQKLYGKIKGVTDREYYTNSSHIPVYFDINAFDKIRLEAPYHSLENAGHICYVELDGDISTNISAFETVIRCMYDNGVGYGAINHPVDTDPVCGYVGIINDVCPRCGRRANEAMTEEMWNILKNKV